ncbi:phage/plasmid replication protein, II/X family, partial [Acinetobacter johnsonii]|uniref:phage/plasmid replication protein, II/X family n=3 Tax=Moraxellaceae TaxID=468 RepID=UPI0024492639
MNKNKKSFDVDWIDVVVDVDHNPLELSEGGYIFFDKNQNIEQEKILYKSKMIESQTRQTIKVKSKGSKLRISGNLYKWLNGQNVDGSHSVVNLVTDTILVLKKMNLISPTNAQLNEIKKGKFELYCVHIKFDLIFDDKEISIKYLNNIKNGGRYPYRKKTLYQNGVYFGQNSKHWVLGFYHKGNELSSNKRKNLISKELALLANRMIRKEIKIYSRKLKELNLKFGYNWFDINYLEKLFYNEFNKLEMPDFRRTAQVSTIKNKADQKFYNFVLDGTVLDFYSRT